MTINAITRKIKLSGEGCSFGNLGACRVDVVAGEDTSLINGGLFTISGTFPSKTQAAPIFFEDFESWSAGTSYTSIGLTDDGGGDGTGSIQVSTGRAYLGTKALLCDYAAGNSGQFPRIVLDGLSKNEIFASCALYWERYTTGTDPGSALIFKQWRAGKSPVYSSTPRSFQTVRPSYSTGVIGSSDKGFVNSSGSNNFNGGDGTCHRDQWNRTDHWYKLSSPGVADGVCAFYSNLSLDEANSSSPLGISALACATRGSADSGSMIEQVMTPLDGVDINGTDNAYYVYLDHLYIDDTPVRVELGDASTYSACTQRVICPASSWSTTSITAKAYTGRWTTGATVYAYVVGSDNTVAAGPFQFTVG